MDKLRAAARQALEALESYSKSDYIKKQHPKRRANGEKAITALRKALAEQATVSDGLCGGCAKKAADGWALYCVECWEKAEQEPVAWVEVERGIPMFMNFTEDYKPYINNGIAPLYAAPVRTKDLTYEEKADLLESVDWYNFPEDLINAVIAADREKNKCQ